VTEILDITTKHCTVERDGAVVILTMNRPEKKNALSGDMLAGLVLGYEYIDETPEVRSHAASLIRELAEHAARNGQQIALEIYEDTYVGTCDEAVKFLKEVGHDACGLNPDIGNLIRLHRPIEPVQDMLDKVLAHLLDPS
jgi:sugar phosphate isomerase/epimerase